ncbi:hypothetical protein EU537_03600 [Candidatus Thorarchaeota archaeon]|nr:MAG: hypothetical protein EU537_03600 [Candidatus Thorarchaeota archaeon]
MRADDDSLEMESELRGNTLRVYWYMIQQNEPVGVREVQKALNMSSPSVASHHLNKLINLDLAQKMRDNSYGLIEIVKVGVLRNFVGYRGRLLPRYSFIAVFFTVFTVVYGALTFVMPIGFFDRMIALVLGFIGAVFSWVETYRLWNLKIV